MASKLKVDVLRSQLSLRGLDDTGTKPILVKRLESALRKEEKEKENGTKKRPRESKEALEDDASRNATPNGKNKRPRDSLEEKPEERVSIKKLQKMGVRQLRELASRHHLPENGSKKELIERLSVDRDKDSKENLEEDASRTDAANGSNKRLKDSLDESPEDEELFLIEKLQKMGVRQLRELASCRHLPENGSKKELIERLLADREDPEEKDKVAGGLKEEKMITATKKGGAVLDQWLPDYIKSSFHVLQSGEEIYDAILNQTNVGANNNKFYVIQALESDDGEKFLVYNRWGRVGVRGQDNLHGPYTSPEKAIAEFQMKFFDKTKNHWSNRKNFTFHPKCYTWLEMDYEAEKGTVPKKADVSIGTQLRETKLEPRIAKFISLICNISMMKQQMLEIGYNAEKLPLGKLSKSTILKGYDVLKRIADVISQPDRKTLEQLSGEFYTVIPHDFGFRKMREFIIDTPFKLKCKLEMVAALAEIEIATKILKDDAGLGDDPLYSRYRQLCCELTPVEVNSEEFSMIEKYMRNTHAKTHSSYTVDIDQIFKVSRAGETEHFSKFSSVKNRMLLWHGSRLTNWTGILSQGLRIAPPEAPSTGYMFGKGVYFADMFSKSANYCFATKECTTGVLLLCEVALGGMAELLSADYNADRLPEGKLSTKGVGATAPDMSEAQALEDGLVVPLGKPKEQTGQKGNLLYNEYIVYNVQQIRMRYVVHVNFKWNSS